jgi:hypothetical protein
VVFTLLCDRQLLGNFLNLLIRLNTQRSIKLVKQTLLFPGGHKAIIIELGVISLPFGNFFENFLLVGFGVA